MDINNAIDVANNSTLIFIAHPIKIAYLYVVEVTKVKKNKELHFIIQKGDGSYDEPILNDHESAVCLQVLSAFREDAQGLEISDIHFYARYDKFWHHISFNKFDSNKVNKAWPECDSGEALGIPIVERMVVSDLVKIPVVDDFSAHPFFYWWHSVEATTQAFMKYEDELINSLRTSARNIPFGNITYEATEKNTYKSIFAKQKKILFERLKTICDAKEVVYQTPIIKAKDSKGWVSIIVYFDKLEVMHQVYEPGAHKLDECYFEYLREILSGVGRNLEIISDDSWSVVLPTEIDLTKINGSMTLFRRGEYQFSMLNNSEYI